MDFAQLKRSLKTTIAPAYLVHGTDYFLVNKSLALLTDVLPDAEVTKYDATVTPEAVVAALQTTSFFNNRRLVIYPLEDKVSVTALNQYLRQPDPNSVLVLLQFTEKPNAHLKNITTVNCNPMAPEILMPLIAHQIAPKQITKEAAQYLIDATGGFYSLIDNELTKLLAYYDNVPVLEVQHLQPYIEKTLDFQIYELGTAIIQYNLPTACKIFAYLLAGNTNDYAIFGGIVSQLRRAYYATQTTADINVVGQFLGCSPYAVKFARRDFGRYSQVVAILYHQALQYEYQIKAGQMTATAAVNALIYR